MAYLERQDVFAARAGIFSLWAEHDERAKLIVDELGEVLWANPAALDLIESLDPIDPVDRGGDGACWPALLRKIVARVDGSTAWICVPYARDGKLLCAATQLRSEEGRPWIGLTLKAMADAPSVKDGALQGIFHLTTAERRIVQALFKGRTAEEAGATLDISVGTVRVHIRHIYEKLAVGSREAMFHKLLPYIAF